MTIGNIARRIAVLVAAMGLALPRPLPAQTDSAEVQAALTKTLDKKQLSGVTGSVQGNVAVLQGTVTIYDAKQEAENRARHVKGIRAVENDIHVNGPDVPDNVLQQKLVKAVEYDMVGYGTTAFDAISVAVHDGVVTLGGHAYGPVDADTAVGVVSNTKGVKDVINNIEIDPTSPMDDRIRLQAFRTIYGFPMLNQYAVDPAKPIRISVQNGNLTLYGVVNTQADKQAAGIRANTVPGVFRVVNDLQVANGGGSGK